MAQPCIAGMHCRRTGLVCVKGSFWYLADRSYGVMVSTLDFESSDPGSSPGRTSFLCVFVGRGV